MLKRTEYHTLTFFNSTSELLYAPLWAGRLDRRQLLWHFRDAG